MSIISRIFGSYRESLQHSLERYENTYLDNANHVIHSKYRGEK